MVKLGENVRMLVCGVVINIEQDENGIKYQLRNAEGWTSIIRNPDRIEVIDEQTL